MTVSKSTGRSCSRRRRRRVSYPGDTWSGRVVTWTREHCRGGSLTVSLSGDAQLLPNGSRVTASSGESVHVVPNQVARLRVPLVPKDGICSARFVVSPTAVPAEVIPGSTDSGVLGVHFNAFAYQP